MKQLSAPFHRFEKGSESLCESPKVIVRGFKPSAIQLLGPGRGSQPLNSQSIFKGVWYGVRCMLDQKGEEEVSQVKTSLKRSSLAPPHLLPTSNTDGSQQSH